MAENKKLLKITEQFISNKCLYKKEKNFSFEVNYHPLGKNNLPIIYDNTHFIPCLIQTNEELDKVENDSRLIIKDSKLELVFYKTESEPKSIKCCFIIDIKNYVIINNKKEEENLGNFDKEKIIDINKDNKVIKKLKKFLYDYIKKNNSKNDKNFSLNKLFLSNAKDNIKIFNNDNNIINQNDLIKNLESEIKIKEGKNLDEILDELFPEFKEELITKYIDEMPDEIVNLQKKYKKINFTNDIYKKYMNDYNNKEKEKEDEIKEENK